ncbi:repressor [Rahnella victoriana]|uniref:LexA family transcriptional regulator n=1 Tax=Rahnella victoriana TaxID=1510570 RepID=UPI000BB18E1E|nr:XRE family transcriptional regulator [Rahnella victoriana]PBI79637.1 repressor [Rahnella victoriana]
MVHRDKLREEFSQRLAQACKDAGLDEHGRGMSLARALNVTSKAVSKWLNAESVPRQDKMNELAKFLRADVLWLQHGNSVSGSSYTTIPDDIEYVGKVRLGAVPVVGEAALGVDGMIQMEEHPAGWLQIYSADPNAYGLRVRGDSMHPRIQSGEFVVIEPGTRVQSGDEVFVRTTDGHNMIKVMTKMRDGAFQLSSINNDHRPITLQQTEIEKMEYVSAIIKATRFVATADVSE